MAINKKRISHNVVPSDVKVRLTSASNMDDSGDRVIASVKKACKSNGVYPLVFMYVKRNGHSGVFTGAAEDEENLVYTGLSTNAAVCDWLANVFFDSCGGCEDMAVDILNNVIEHRNELAKEKGYKDPMEYYDKTLIEPYDEEVKEIYDKKISEVFNRGYERELNRITISKKKE